MDKEGAVKMEKRIRVYWDGTGWWAQRGHYVIKVKEDRVTFVSGGWDRIEYRIKNGAWRCVYERATLEESTIFGLMLKEISRREPVNDDEVFAKDLVEGIWRGK